MLNRAWSNTLVKIICEASRENLSQINIKLGSTSKTATIRLFFFWDTVNMAENMTAENVISKNRPISTKDSKKGAAIM